MPTQGEGLDQPPGQHNSSQTTVRESVEVALAREMFVDVESTHSERVHVYRYGHQEAYPARAGCVF